MKLSKQDWATHVAAFEHSPKSLSEYCHTENLKADTFRYHLYKSRRKARSFREVMVRPELTLSVGSDGSVSLQSIDPSVLPKLVSAWSDAISK